MIIVTLVICSGVLIRIAIVPNVLRYHAPPCPRTAQVIVLGLSAHPRNTPPLAPPFIQVGP